MEKPISSIRILFFGFNHQVNDARLFHREMKALKLRSQDTQIYFLSLSGLLDVTPLLSETRVRSAVARKAATGKSSLGLIYEALRGNFIFDLFSGIYKGLRQFLQEGFAVFRVLPAVIRLRPNFIQMSDIRELHWGWFLRALTRARLIYDVHEDYFNQIYEFSGRSGFALMKARAAQRLERFLLPSVHAVFCADDFVFEAYSRLAPRGVHVFLLRNYPLTLDFPSVSNFDRKDTLHLVYIGGVNQYRGVIECAGYVADFNRIFKGEKQLTFAVYSSASPIVTDLEQRGLIRHISSMDYVDLLQELVHYDAGICLWLPLQKFYHNLPLKNFDYMSVGLPIITSNFGNLSRYASESGGAFCIDPLDYKEFESAVLRLFDPLERKKLSESGLRYIQTLGSFQRESEAYIKTIFDG